MFSPLLRIYLNLTTIHLNQINYISSHKKKKKKSQIFDPKKVKSIIQNQFIQKQFLSRHNQKRNNFLTNLLKLLPSLPQLQVSLEYGLCEMINSIAIRLNVAPKDGNLSFDISELAAMLPVGTVDNNVEMVYKEVHMNVISS